jgi:hypothetical protein
MDDEEQETTWSFNVLDEEMEKEYNDALDAATSIGECVRIMEAGLSRVEEGMNRLRMMGLEWTEEDEKMMKYYEGMRHQVNVVKAMAARGVKFKVQDGNFDTDDAEAKRILELLDKESRHGSRMN